MDIFITGIIGLALGLSIGYILGARREAEKHRQCHRRMRQTIEGLPGIMLGLDFAKKDADRAVAFEAKIEKGKLVSVKPVQLPKDFGKMKDEVETTPAVKTLEKKKRISKPRTAAQRERAKMKMREYRLRARLGKKGQK